MVHLPQNQHKKKSGGLAGPRLYFAVTSPPYIEAASAIYLAAALALAKLIVVLVLVARLGNGFLRLEDYSSPDSDS